MKKLLLILFISSILSCTMEAEQPVENDLMGEWVLVKTTGQFSAVEYTGNDMPFQESYHLQEDGTFLKLRMNDGEQIEATGTYEFLEDGYTIYGEEVRKFIEFQYESENELIANCTRSFTEHLYFTTGGELISTYQACDGLGLYYEKMD